MPPIEAVKRAHEEIQYISKYELPLKVRAWEKMAIDSAAESVNTTRGIRTRRVLSENYPVAIEPRGSVS